MFDDEVWRLQYDARRLAVPFEIMTAAQRNVQGCKRSLALEKELIRLSLLRTEVVQNLVKEWFDLIKRRLQDQREGISDPLARALLLLLLTKSPPPPVENGDVDQNDMHALYHRVNQGPSMCFRYEFQKGLQLLCPARIGLSDALDYMWSVRTLRMLLKRRAHWVATASALRTCQLALRGAAGKETAEPRPFVGPGEEAASRWTMLPVTAMALVLENLPATKDAVAVAGVCRGWRARCMNAGHAIKLRAHGAATPYPSYRAAARLFVPTRVYLGHTTPVEFYDAVDWTRVTHMYLHTTPRKERPHRLPGAPALARLQAARGTLRVLRVSSAYMAAHGSTWVQALAPVVGPTLETLMVGDGPWGDTAQLTTATVELVPDTLPRCRHLTLRHGSIAGAAGRIVQEMPRLEHLALTSVATPPAWLDTLGLCAGLTRLHLNNVAVGARVLRGLVAAAASLEALSLIACLPSRMDEQLIIDMLKRHRATLTSLNLSHNKAVGDDCIRTMMSSVSLESLRAMFCGIHDVQSIDALRHIETLRLCEVGYGYM